MWALPLLRTLLLMCFIFLIKNVFQTPCHTVRPSDFISFSLYETVWPGFTSETGLCRTVLRPFYPHFTREIHLKNIFTRKKENPLFTAQVCNNFYCQSNSFSFHLQFCWCVLSVSTLNKVKNHNVVIRNFCKNFEFSAFYFCTQLFFEYTLNVTLKGIVTISKKRFFNF